MNMGMILSYVVQQHTNTAAELSQDAEILEFYFADPDSVRQASGKRELAIEAEARAELAKAYLARTNG
jgi:hypothetical protein